MRKTVKFSTASRDHALESVYKNAKISFALCSIEKEEIIKQRHHFMGCREAVIAAVPDLLKSSKIPTKNTWISIHRKLKNRDDKNTPKGESDGFKQHAKNAVNLLNHFETRTKWLKTKVYNTKHSTDSTIYVFKGSRWWLTSPHTLSLYMLLIRISGQSQFNNITKKTTTNSIIKHILATPESHWDHQKTREADMWTVLLDKRRKIFGKKGPAKNFEIVENHGSYEGVLSLTQGNCYDKTTYDKFKVFCKEAGLK